MNSTTWFRLGACLAGLAVIAGAFGAHYLKERMQLESRLLETFETGVRYQMYHALALVACGIAAPRLRPRPAAWAAALFVTGIVLFSGSLYVLVLAGTRSLGIVTPFGGVAWLLANRKELFALATRAAGQGWNECDLVTAFSGKAMGQVWRQSRENSDGSSASPTAPDTPPVRAWLM